MESAGAWRGRDLGLGTAIALAMGTAFGLCSPGSALLVTFVPGVIFAWSAFVWLYSGKAELPSRSTFLPLFFCTLGVQCLHCAEEYVTGFQSRFPRLYGGEPYSDAFFLSANLIAYGLFAAACLLVFLRNRRYLLIPVLFFAVYGAMGNAIAHTWWSLYLGSYFPGVVTAQAYWILGPWLLHRLLGSRRAVLVLVVAFALVLLPALTLFMTPGQ